MAEEIPVPYNCPKCGEHGHIRSNALGKSLICRGCKFVFHIDRLMRPVPGPRPPDADRDRNEHLDHRTQRRKPLPKWLRGLEPYLQGKWLYAYGGAAALLFLGLVWGVSRVIAGPPLPPKLEDRAALATAAIQADDPASLVWLCAEGGRSDARNLIDKVLATERTAPKLKVSHRTDFKDRKSGEAGSQVRFLDVKGNVVVVVRYYWKLVGSDEDWRLDLPQTANQRLTR